MTGSAFGQDWYLFFQPYCTLYINQAYSEWNVIYTYLFVRVQLSILHDGVILLPRSESFLFFISYSISVIPARFP